MNYQRALEKALLLFPKNSQGIKDCELLFLELLNLSKKQFYRKSLKSIPNFPSFWKKFTHCLKRANNGEPLQYILGTSFFYEKKFLVGKGVLIPRPETELLVENAINKIKSLFHINDSFSILDLCTGTGVIALSLEHSLTKLGFKKFSILATDISQKAISYAKKNKNFLKLRKTEFLLSDLFSKINQKRNFNIILANPPYISANLYKNLEAKVKNYEPKEALLAHNGGMEIILKIFQEGKNFLKQKSFILCEISDEQASILKLKLQKQYSSIKLLKDFNKKNRFILATP